MKNRRQTRNYFPEPQFQLRFLAILVAGALFQMGIVGALLYHFLKENYTLLVKYAALDEPTTRVLYDELRLLTLTIGGTFLLYLVVLTALGIRFSHKIVAVMAAMKRTMAEINRGEDVTLSLRPGDHFQDVQDAFNAMVKRLRDGQQKAS